ncbi:TonB-dependent receptor [candidate division KSB1 bacterium]|nr:TonB-dependent receptor [candidate division KSB1 bacterium]
MIKGIVLDRATRQPLPGANIRVLGTPLGAATGADGRFVLSPIPSGTYTLEASLIGYQPQRLENKSISASAALELHFELIEAPVPLSEIIVTPGRFAIMQNEPAVRQTLTREEISTIPHFGEDIYRAVQRLPGISGNDFNAKFTVRGGENEEVLVLLDGLELYEPFHLNDIGGGLSIVDVEAIGGINLMTGGFTVEYGDKLSGVFDISSITPDQGTRRTALGLSFLNARFKTEGRFNDDKGRWFVSARRGYIDLVLKLIGEDEQPSPDYYDALGKVQYRLNDRHTLSIHALRSGDRFDLLDKDEGDKVGSSYGNTYGWLTLKSSLRPTLFAQTVLSAGRVNQDRAGTDFTGADRQVRAHVTDVRDFQVYNFKQDWSFNFSDRHFIKWGFDAKSLHADYDYFNRQRIEAIFNPNQYDTTIAKTDLSGRKLGVYLADRMRLIKPLTAELGVRYDDNTYTHDKKFSPRLNLAYTIGKRSVVRLGWGRFYQTQGIHELEVQDGEDKFFPAESAEHRVIGFEHAFENNVNLRVEAYQKRLANLRTHYGNLLDPFNIFPEVEEDRVTYRPERGEAKGVELFVKKDNGGKINWWGSYAFAFAEDRINGKTVPRNFDQRHTVYLDFNYRPNLKWRLNVAWQYHSGWPFTEAAFEEIKLADGSSFYQLVYGQRNAARLPAYHRLDVRANRYFEAGKGRLAVFLEVINLYDRTNVRTYDNYIRRSANGQLIFVKETQEWLPRLPSIGISWEF